MATACGFNPNNQAPRVAVIKWQEALAAHPKYQLLLNAEKELRQAEQMRNDQLKTGREQIALLDRLVLLKQQTRANFNSADYVTKMAERKVVQEEKLQEWRKTAEQEVELLIRPQRETILSEYQLPIVNLRLKLENDKLPEEQRLALESELKDTLVKQNAALKVLENKKQVLLQEKINDKKMLLARESDGYGAELATSLSLTHQSGIQADQVDLAKGPQELSRVLEAMDKQVLLKHQTFINLRKELDEDIQNSLEEVTKSRDDVFVIKDVVVVIDAEDLTNEVITILKNKKIN